MSYRKKDIALAISLMLFIISFAIVATVFCKPLYTFDISYLNIEAMTGLTSEVLKENYSLLIDYQSILYRGALQLPDFVMSQAGRIHFEEVKRIFEVIQVVMIITLITSLYGIIKSYKQGEYRYLKLTSLITIIVPCIIGFFAAIDFDRAFVLFHQIVFRNDFWIFDARVDPVINALPEAFFMHAFFMIVLIVLVLAFLCYHIYHRQTQKILNG